MKIYIKFLLLMMTSFSGGLYAQHTVDKDSLLTTRIHHLAFRLSLSSSQEATFLSLARQEAKSLDSASKLQMTSDRRKEWLDQMVQVRDRKIRILLDPRQWQQYNMMLQHRKEAFLNKMTAKRIKVDTLKN